MKYKTILQTFLSRFLILILSFGLIIYTTNVWGSAGKGVVSIVTADLAIIMFLSNIFAGGSVSFFSSKFQTGTILFHAYLWSIVSGVVTPLLLSWAHPQSFTVYLIGLSVLTSLLTTNINLFVGKQHIKMYNLYTILQLAVHFAFILGMVNVLHYTDITGYFVAQILAYVLLFIISFVQIFRLYKLSEFKLSKNIVAQLFSYGWKSQLSAFLQFLNNRLSYYFLEFFKGIATVGIFSVGVAFSEAIWTMSRTLALVLYADIINSEQKEDAILKTKISMKISFLVTLVSLGLMLLIPASLYAMIFGKDFSQTKEIIILLSPGILAIAVSNVLGFYFAGVNKLRILNIKSLVGLVFTIIASWYCIPRWGIVGGCIVTSVSYLLSSGILFWNFYQLTTFKIQDFFFSRTDFQLLLQKIKRRP